MGVSIALAIIFPYQDLNAQQQAVEQSASLRGTVPPTTEGGGILGNGGVEEVGGVGIGGLVADDSVLGDSSVAMVQTDVVNKETFTNAILEGSINDKKDSVSLESNVIAKAISNKEEGAEEIQQETASESVVGAAASTSENEEDIVVSEPIAAKQEDAEEPSEDELTVEAAVVIDKANSIVVDNEATITEQENEEEEHANNELIISENEPIVAEQKEEEVPPTEEVVEPVVTAATVEEPTTVVEEGLDIEQYVQAEISAGLFGNKEETPTLEDNSSAITTTQTETMPELSTIEIQQCHTLLQQEADIVHPRDILGPVEYTAFLSKMKQANIGSASEADIPNQYAYLSEELKTNFVQSKCNCPPTNVDCCMDVHGIYVGQGSDLDKICENTLMAFDKQ
jgi:hypothetical protein